MSFTSEIKQELNKSNSLSNKEYIKYELIGYLLTNNISFVDKSNIKFVTESEYNINRFSKILSNLNIEHDIGISGKSFFSKIKIKNLLEKKLGINIDKENHNIRLLEELKCEIELKNEKEKEKEIEKQIIKGTFMGSGSINDPAKNYHLEINLSNKENMNYVKNIIGQSVINMKEMELPNKYCIYLKDGEEISKFLALIGANKAVLSFEEIRIEKEMRGKVNRLVNCETANLNKTINASIEQIAAIKKLHENGKMNKLDDNLKEIAKIRIENPDMSLVELGNLLNVPIGKSGVNYRLKKIIELANEI